MLLKNIRILKILFVFSLVLALLAGPMAWAKKKAFDSGRVSFSLRCDGVILGYRVQALLALPGEVLDCEVLDANWDHTYALESDAGQVESKGDRRWSWTVPLEPGVYPGQLGQEPDGEAMQIYLIVLVPVEQVQDGVLNGYRIGEYPESRPGQNGDFAPPRGFIEVTEQNQDLELTPHFRLSQFLCREQGDFPKYVVLDERLLIKLETLLAKANLRGYACRTLNVSSGFRTPFYNHQRGFALYSLHQWGRAADVFIDGNYDGKMDDLNRNGRSDFKDVRLLTELVESIDEEPRHRDKIGGVGLYDDSDRHGPFVHIDVRGEPARWQKVKK